MKKDIIRGVIAIAALSVLFVGGQGFAKQNDKKIAICHRTGSASHPYVYIEISENGLNGHRHHEGDLIPAPNAECIPAPQTTGVCHATGDPIHPFDFFELTDEQLTEHLTHLNDIIPATPEDCQIIGA